MNRKREEVGLLLGVIVLRLCFVLDSRNGSLIVTRNGRLRNSNAGTRSGKIFRKKKPNFWKVLPVLTFIAQGDK